MEFSIDNFRVSFWSAVSYVPVTIKITVVSFLCSIVIGFIIGTIRHIKIRIISKILDCFVTVYLGLPIMVALVIYNLVFMIYYKDIAAIFGIHKNISEIDPVVIAYIALILANSCSLSESVRGAFRGVDIVQYEAGYSIGLTKVQTLIRIIVPQMIPIMIPGMVNSMIGTLKASNLVSVIGVTEVMVAALLPCQETYSYLEGYLAAALVYWILGIMIEILSAIAEKKSMRFRRKIVT